MVFINSDGTFWTMAKVNICYLFFFSLSGLPIFWWEGCSFTFPSPVGILYCEKTSSRNWIKLFVHYLDIQPLNNSCVSGLPRLTRSISSLVFWYDTISTFSRSIFFLSPKIPPFHPKDQLDFGSRKLRHNDTDIDTDNWRSMPSDVFTQTELEHSRV